MLTYWLIYLILASMALFTSGKQQNKLMPWLLVGLFFILFIGLRYDVGGDWSNYVQWYDRMQGLVLKDAMSYGDPGHQFLNWLSHKWDLGVYGSNIIYGVVFTVGLIKFSREQMYPWLVMVVAMPYLVIVVAMGYSRQGVAIGLFLLAITYLQKGKFKTYVFLIFVAALFHKTAVLLFPLGVFLYGKGLVLRFLMVIPLLYGAWDLLVAGDQDRLWNNYVDAQMQSAGAKIRVAMNLLPSLLLLMYRKEWKKSFNDYSFWFWIAIGSIISVVLVNFASSAVDRISLYFIPIQLVVYARLPYLARKNIAPSVIKVLIVVVYALALFVWSTFGVHSHAWIPYQNLISQVLL